MLDVAFINTPIAKLSFSSSKVTLDDFLHFYPSLGRVCHLRETEWREQERLFRSSGAVAAPVSFLPRAIALCSDTEKLCLLGEEFLCFESSLYVELKLLCSGYQ